LIAGFISNLILFGIDGLVSSVIGFVLPLVLLSVLYVLRMLGAGDIKLFAVIGSIMGYKFILWTLALSFISGGIIAFIIVIIKGHAVGRFKHLSVYLMQCFLSQTIKPYSETNSTDKTNDSSKKENSKFHFSYAIACGTILNLFFSTFNF
jgi:prepilin peptidase CpaA